MKNSLIIYISLIFIVLMPFAGKSFTIKLKGENPEYKSYKLSFYRYSDLLSMTEIKLAECVTDTAGKFECQIDIPATCQVFVYLGYYKGIFFAEPKKTYELVFPPKKEKTLVDELNPFFTEEEIGIGIKNSKENELNYLISKFNSMYETFLTDNFNYLYVYADVKMVDSLIQKINIDFGQNKNQFFQDYVTYKLNYLRHFAYDRDRNFATKKYFAHKPVLYQNPGYMEFLNQLWGKYFTCLAINEKIGDRLISNIVYSKSPYELNKTMSLNLSLRDDTLRELVILRGLADCLTKPDIFPLQTVIQTLDSIAGTSQLPEHRLIASNLIKKENKMHLFDTAPDFVLRNAKGEDIALKDYRGKYVYLCFGRSENYACLKDYRLIKDINDKKINGLEILTISSDQDTAVFQDFVASNPQYSWTFLYDKNKDITFHYGIRIQPSYILIDPDGKIAMMPAITPQQNFVLYFSQIQKWRQRAIENKLRNSQGIKN